MIVRQYTPGVDFSKEELLRWKEQLMWWISSTMPKVKDVEQKANVVLRAGLEGTKLDGGIWPAVPEKFTDRIKLSIGFDLEKGVGIRNPRKAFGRSGYSKTKIAKVPSTDSAYSIVDNQVNLEDMPPTAFEDITESIRQYKKDLIDKYPHLEGAVYSHKIDELAETVMKSRMLSNEFMTARGGKLVEIAKTRESMHKQMGELMDFLEISPKSLVKKQRDVENADVGSLIAKLESFGEIWADFERVDALRELLQRYHQLHSLRPDGTPQLNDWELWHLTRTKPIHFTCRNCTQEYTLLDGFTPEEIEQALVQAHKVYGFGLEPIAPDPQSSIIDETALTIDDNAALPGRPVFEENPEEDATLDERTDTDS
jgi:hypothetical protein